MTSTLDYIINALKKVAGEPQPFIPLHEPTFHGNEWNYVKSCIDDGWVSSVGSYVDRLEADLADYLGAKHAVVVVNGTAALHVSLMLAGVERDNEVLIPSLSFVATANAVAYCGAIPHFVDVSEETLGLDPYQLEAYLQETAIVKDGICINKSTNRIIRAVVPMHTFGHPVDMDPLLCLCERYHITCVEDAAESLGSTYKQQHTGTLGKIGAFSFNGNKVMTTGGGGAIVTNDSSLAKHAKHMTTTAKLPHKWSFYHDETGFNYRMPNLNAALGCAQLESLESFLTAKRKLAGRYAEHFKHIQGVRLVEEPEYARSNYWLNALVLDKPDSDTLHRILEATNEAGWMTRPIWTPLHLLPMYQDSPMMPLATTERLQHQVINIPSSPTLAGV